VDVEGVCVCVVELLHCDHDGHVIPECHVSCCSAWSRWQNIKTTFFVYFSLNESMHFPCESRYTVRVKRHLQCETYYHQVCW